MKRLRVSVWVDGECAAACGRVEMVAAGGRRVCGVYALGLDAPRWVRQWLAGPWWLGPDIGAGWMEAAWQDLWHVRSGWRIEAVSPPTVLAAVTARVLLERAPEAPDAVVVAEQCVRISSEPVPVEGLRLIGADGGGKARFGLR